MRMPLKRNALRLSHLVCNALGVLVLLSIFVSGFALGRENNAKLDKLTYHNNFERTGWNDRETRLTPQSVSAGSFGPLWRTGQLDSFGEMPPRLYASPLYVDKVAMTIATKRQTLSVIYAVASTGYAYAVNAFTSGDTPAGTVLWRVRLTEKPCLKGTGGNLSTPVVDLKTQRLYVTSCDDELHWRAHALDIRSGKEAKGWPMRFDAARVSAVNRNGSAQFGETANHIQRGALGLSPNGSRLYVAFSTQGGIGNGWIVAIDTRRAQIATAFSSTARTEEIQGGMWASGGPAIDAQGRVHIATGANVMGISKNLGVAGVFPDSANSWGQSILQFKDDPRSGFELVGTYTPFNYCSAAAADIDLGSSGTIVIDLDPRTTRTPRLLALGGGKQGNAYLLDRERMPGELIQRQACSEDSASDRSLLSPNVQPQFGRRGPLSVFAPYAEDRNIEDQAKSRATAAYFRAARGKSYLFVTGSAKTGENLTLSKPPGLVRLEVVTKPDAAAYLRIDQAEQSQIFHNPGSPVVTSHEGENAIVWVLDQNIRRTSPLYGPNSPKPVLYAFDALSLRLLWKSTPGQLSPSGKYNEPTIVRGTVFVGTDRIEAFGLNAPAIVEEASRTMSATDQGRREESAAASDRSSVSHEKIDAAGIYSQRCALCHESRQPPIPTREALAALSQEKIVFTLQYGAMQTHALGLSEAELSALAAYLAPPNRSVGEVTTARLLKADDEPAAWLTGGRDYRQSYYSPLARIDKQNIRELGFAWEHPIDSTMNLTATPIVVDGVMFTSAPLSKVYALDAKTGVERWKFTPQIDETFLRRACCGPVNRGVAVWRGKVYVGSVDGYLYALQADTGAVVWRADTFIDRSRGYSITGAPYIAKDRVVIGNGGADFDARGYVTAYDTETGKQAWRFFTVPAHPSKGFEHPELEMAAKTWDPNSLWEIGLGGTAWDGMAYDPVLNLLYVGTGNANPWPRKLRSPAGGDNLFVSSILAINPDNGRLAWHYQTAPGDNWDYTATQKMILADLKIGGEVRSVLMQAPKNGFFYVLDRKTGELLSAKPYTKVTWASHVDLETGRPVETAQSDYSKEPKLIYPGAWGGHSWQPMAFNPTTGLVYIPVIDIPMVFAMPTEPFKYRKGQYNYTTIHVPITRGGDLPTTAKAFHLPPIHKLNAGQPLQGSRAYLRAWDPIGQKVVWDVDVTSDVDGVVGVVSNSGVMTTASGLVFHGRIAGEFSIRDSTTGAELHRIELGDKILAAPMTYDIDGQQYVAVMASADGGQSAGRIVAFKLGGAVVPRSSKNAVGRTKPPVPFSGTAEQVRLGGKLFERHCSTCHLGGRAPDLTKMEERAHHEFIDIVLHGLRVDKGMGNFRDLLSDHDAQAIHAYLTDLAWASYRRIEHDNQ